jgi:hypothetical protein
VKLAAALLIGWVACLPAHSAEEPVDPVLLEFLGSVDSEDKHWHEYLAHTDIEKVVAHRGATHENEPPATAPPQRSPPVDPPSPSPAPVNQTPVNQK